MAPDADDTDAQRLGCRPGEAAAGSPSTGVDEAALYSVIHAAVKDALLDVIGTLLLVGIAFVLVVAGGQALLTSTSTAAIAIGFTLVVCGLYLAAATLEVIPPIRDWL